MIFSHAAVDFVLFIIQILAFYRMRIYKEMGAQIVHKIKELKVTQNTIYLSFYVFHQKNIIENMIIKKLVLIH